MRLQTILLSLLWAVSTIVYADTIADVDSLLRVYDNSQGNKRLSIGRQLVEIYGGSSVFFDGVPTISTDMSREEQDLMVWFGTERFYTTNSYYAEALDYNERAMKLIEKGKAEMKDAQSSMANGQWSMANTLLCDKAYCLFKRSDYTKSIETCQEAIRQCQETDDKMQLSRAYLYLSLVNHALQKYDEAKSLVVKSIETNRQLGLNVQTHNALGVACEIFCSAKEVDKAIDYGRQAVEAAHAIGYMPGVTNHLTQLSYAYDRKGDYAMGLLMADSAIAMVKATEPLDRNQLALALEFKGWNLIDIGRQREAADALREAIDLQLELGNEHAACYDYRTLSEALETIDPQGSIAALRRYTRMSDSIHTEQLKELMSQADAKFHNDELKEENAASRRMNRIILWTALIVVILLTLAIASLSFAFRQKKRAAMVQQRMMQAREEFFTNVTHEFRTPLTVILGLAEELKNLTPTGEAETIKRQAQHLLTLVNQILDISKVKTTIGEQPRTQGDLTAYVAMVVERHREMARQKDITLTYETDKHPIETAFVADYTDKTVSNLLSNAIKYTPKGGRVRVTLTSHPTLSPQTITLSVSDTGKGIPPEHLPHIFEPFFCVSSGGQEGTGVGLALVKQIADALHGEVSVKSEVGKGTTVSITVPAIGINGTNGVNEVIEVQRPHSSHPTLLIVEDNADVAALIGRQMEGRYTLHFAADGDEGIAKAHELMPDLIITDLMMPGTDGLQLCRNIRSDEATNHIPIVVVTAKATDDDRIKGRKAGADAYLYKPFNADELNVCVEQLLEQRERLRRKFMTTVGTSPIPARNSETAPIPANDIETDRVTEDNHSFAAPSEEFIVNVNEAIRELMATRESNVEMVASKLCITPYQLRNKLTAITGVTPKKYILKARMEFARQMLIDNPSRTIGDVADSCGFYDKSHFIRTFREAFNMTPNDFVKSQLRVEG